MIISFFFFFNDTATTEIYTLSLHDALPICRCARSPARDPHLRCHYLDRQAKVRATTSDASTGREVLPMDQELTSAPTQPYAQQSQQVSRARSQPSRRSRKTGRKIP